MPSGRYLMEDFFEAGGLPAIIRELGSHDRLHREALTVNGSSLWDNNREAPCWNADVIHPFDAPFKHDGGIVVLKGNLAPDGAVLKPSAATPELMKHTGRAVVFESIEDLKTRINDDDLDIDETCVMVLKNCGPKGYPGMAEVGNLPLPPKLLKLGITDMVRISDARMSGTAYGTVVLHCAPEAAIGGPLALVQNGDLITLDVKSRRLTLEVSETELTRRRTALKPVTAPAPRGYVKLYVEHVLQANEGADLDFLVGGHGSGVARDNM
jgi:dihydroxy-acid dehydratase